MTDYSDKLVKKVQDALTSNINETSVLYALVSLNKAVQDSHSLSDFPTINLYRDWLVHTDLDRNRQLELFFKKWDKIIEDIGRGRKRHDAALDGQNSIELSKLFDEMQTLRIILDPAQKTQFVPALVKSLIDTPLRWKGKNIKEFRFTDEKKRRKFSTSYICHMQIQFTTGEWFNGPELHFNTSQ